MGRRNKQSSENFQNRYATDEDDKSRREAASATVRNFRLLDGKEGVTWQWPINRHRPACSAGSPRSS